MLAYATLAGSRFRNGPAAAASLIRVVAVSAWLVCNTSFTVVRDGLYKGMFTYIRDTVMTCICGWLYRGEQRDQRHRGERDEPPNPSKTKEKLTMTHQESPETI